MEIPSHSLAFSFFKCFQLWILKNTLNRVDLGLDCRVLIKQPDGKACGFYIMRLMKDLTMSNNPKDYLVKHCYVQKTYSIDEINKVREE
ncbi:hypothetical protein CsatA_005657 [Cannabis sativa]